MNSSMIRSELRKKIALQGGAVIIVGAVFVFFWNNLRKTAEAHIQTSSTSRISGILPSLISDLNLILPITLLAVLFGVACAFYLEEWCPVTSWIRGFIGSQVNFLTEIPSLLYGLLAIMVIFSDTGVLKEIGALPPAENVNESGSEVALFQRNTLVFYAETLIFILMAMPIAIKTTQEALRSVATPIRESAYVLGATQWQVLTKQVVPLAFPKMLAGGCRSMSRALAGAALLIGIHIPSHTTGPRGIPDRFVLFLGGALLLSTISSFLTIESGTHK
ncbi:MAG: ABC transporter permease subunit [Candidatus Poribacteria bacterium]|nr:ABC transporter permease subunit [Candidatus Poribacteria bacterium]